MVNINVASTLVLPIGDDDIIAPVLFCSQGDTARSVSVIVTWLGNHLVFPAGTTVYLAMTNAAGSYIRTDGTVDAAGVAHFDLDGDETSVAGRNFCKVVILSGGKRVSTKSFILYVENRP